MLESQRCQRPSTPSRSRRRIIGGVVRPLPISQESISIQSEVVRSSRKRGKDVAETKKASMSAFIDMCSGDDVSYASARDSSLSRAYDSLGAKFYSMSSDDSTTSRSTKQGTSRACKELTQQELSDACMFGAPAFDRPSPKAAIRLRTTMPSTSLSAMSMDLEGTLGTPGRTPVPFAAFSDHEPLTVSPKMLSSQSLPSLHATRKSGGSFLPALYSDRSTPSIAWSMAMSKSASKLTTTSLRSASSIGDF